MLNIYWLFKGDYPLRWTIPIEISLSKVYKQHQKKLRATGMEERLFGLKSGSHKGHAKEI